MSTNKEQVALRKEDPILSLDIMVANARWLWLLLVALVVVAEQFLASRPAAELTDLLILVGVGLLLNAIYAALIWAKYFPNWLAVIATISDVAFAIILLTMLLPRAQYLLPIMLFPVIIAGVRWNGEVGLLVAIPLIASYALPVVFSLQGEIDRDQLTDDLLRLAVNGLTLVLAGALPGPFLRRRIELVEETTGHELDQLRLANKRGQLVSEMALTLSSTLNYRKVLRAMIDSAFSAMIEGGPQRDESAVAMVLLFEEDDGLLTVAAGRNISRTDQGRRVSAEEGLIGRTISTAEASVTYRAQNDKVLTSFSAATGCRSAICAPLRAGFNTYGVVLFCSTEPDFYDEDHKALLTTFCSQAIIALQNAQLFEDVHHEQQRILEKEAEARRKLARDLHDGPTQSMAAIVMRMDFIKKVIEKKDIAKAYDEVVKVEEIARRTTQEIRTMLFAMRPVILETQGLIPALEQYAERLTADEDFKVKVVNQGYEGQLDQDAEGVIFAIVEEAVGNAKKHAEASQLRIILNAKASSLVVNVQDNGVGFDVAATQSTYDQRTSLGLINMNERAEIVGGQCTIQSASGQGTTVTVEIPFNRALEVE